MGMKSVCELEVAQKRKINELRRRIVRQNKRSHLHC